MKYIRLFWNNLRPNLEATILRTLVTLVCALVPALVIMFFWNILFPEHRAGFWSVWMGLSILELVFRLPLRIDTSKFK